MSRFILLDNTADATQRPHIVETEPFGDTFGPKAQRKRPRLDIGSIEELSESSAAAAAAAEAATAESRTYRYPPSVYLFTDS